MLKLKIKDIDVVQTQTYQIARITVNGKTGTRSPRINNGYPHLKKWLSQGHPFPGVPDSPIFCGVGKKNTGRRLSPRTINAIYENYKNVYFPKLLDDPSISEEDKRKIRDLLKKKWNPYVRRHTAATELSKALKDPVIIDQYMGWSHRGAILDISINTITQTILLTLYYKQTDFFLLLWEVQVLIKRRRTC
jgi:integrase/recombinase XerD